MEVPGRSAGIRANILLSGDQFLQQSNFQQTHPQLVLLAMGFQGPQKEVLEQLDLVRWEQHSQTSLLHRSLSISEG